MKKKKGCRGVSWKIVRTAKWKQRANQKAREKSKGKYCEGKRLSVTKPRGLNKRHYKRNILVNAEGTCRPPPEGLETFLPLLLHPWSQTLLENRVLKGV